MHQFHCITSAVLAAALSALFLPGADAQEIYKWKDANGKVHYGDRAAAPEASQKMHIAVTPPGEPRVVPASAPTARPNSPLPPDAQKKSVPVDPTRVGPECQGLADKIAAVPAGQNWQALSRQFNSACPGISYECVEYVSSPQNNRCTWVEKSGGTILNRKKYP
jgi:hypothetical protein